MVVSDDGEAANIVTKYRPNVPLVVVSSQASVAAQCSVNFGQRGLLVDPAAMSGKAEALVARAVEWAKTQGIYKPGRIAVMHGGHGGADITDTAMIQIVDV